MISLLFCGDFAPIRRYENLIIQKGAYIFGDLLKEIKKNDITFINFESPAYNGNTPIQKSGPAIKANPKTLESLADAGFDAIGLANNHIFDHGKIGFLETLKTCAQYNLNFVGAGRNIKEAQKPLILERKGVKIAIIAVAEHEFGLATELRSGAAPLDPIDNTYQIQKAQNEADFVFVTIHGGNEFFPYPRPGLRKICRYFIDRGVDGVICHHAHVPGAYEFYKNKPIIYSLGNIIFDHLNPPVGWCEGYAVRLNFNFKSKELISFKIIPYHQSIELGGVNLLVDKEKESFIKKIDGYNAILEDHDKYKLEWDTFCESSEKDILSSNFLPLIPGFLTFSNILPIKRIFLSKRSINRKINLIRCESHLELLQSILEKIYNEYED